ncbi:hypothetical protein FHS46_002186 [Variibacter gotjawalensis]|nr:hypothetical protein [Variibacter gotjawalensis]
MSSTSVLAVAPPHAAGAVTVAATTLAGTASLTNAFTYVAAAPTLTSVSPTSGPVTGGTGVTITGNNLSGTTSVTFGGTTASAVTVVNATTVTAVAPAHIAGPVDVVVTTPNGNATLTNSFTYTAAAPTLASASPNSGSAAGGTLVTLSGTNLSGATAVTFGGTAALAVTVINATTVTAVTPAHAVGVVTIAITTPNGTASLANAFSYNVVSTATAVSSSRNPAPAGQAVTFTAVVSSSNGVPIGEVSFRDGATVIGTATLSQGTAKLTTSSLSVGAHSITVVYTQVQGFSGSTSPALVQTVSNAADSAKLRELQIAGSRVVAQNSGGAITSSIDSAIDEAFSESGQFIMPGSNSLRVNFAADPGGREDTKPQRDDVRDRLMKGKLDDAFASFNKAKPRLYEIKSDWRLWLDIKYSGIESAGYIQPLKGEQVNALTGVSYRLSPKVVVGAFGGYETFRYASDTLNGRLAGDGWTVGGYFGWKLQDQFRFDLAAAYSGIDYTGVAATAAGDFTGTRWLISSGFTGTYRWADFAIEPSAKLYTLWEHQRSYTDTLSTFQPARDFMTGRASVGTKAAYSMESAITPYIGLYADYYFSRDYEGVNLEGLASVPILSGWSARVTGGIMARLPNGLSVALGGEYGGIGSDARIWTFRANVRMQLN